MVDRGSALISDNAMNESALTILSPAKLNLFLHITGRRDDGYHELQTLFQLIDLCDTLHFKSSYITDGTTSFRCDHPGVPLHDNLVLQAVRLIRETASEQGKGIDITLEKRIPAGGGLGGGSSNAAITLLALNRLWQLNLSIDQLAEMGLSLGADVPVFIRGRSALAEGIGERLEPLDLPQKHFLILWPRVHVATAHIFSHEQLTRDSPTIKIADFLAGGGRNDCEEVVRQLYPQVDKALIWLAEFGEARLTGTGSCVFAAFDDRSEATRVGNLKPDDVDAFIVSGLNALPEPLQA